MLTYWIQYFEGKANRLIEDCVMMTPKDGFVKALSLLKTEFGKKHEIARAHIDALTSGIQLAASDYDGLTNLATDMQKCYTTLNEIGFVSDINSTHTVRYNATLADQLASKMGRQNRPLFLKRH